MTKINPEWLEERLAKALDRIDELEKELARRGGVMIPRTEPIEHEPEGSTILVLCDCGYEHLGKTIGEQSQALEWWCPIEDELKRDVNA